VAALVDRGFRGMAKTRQHWHGPVGDRRTKDQLTELQRAYNRLQAGLRALVEQSIGHLGTAWGVPPWRGTVPRVRDVYRAAAALMSLGRWLHRVPRAEQHAPEVPRPVGSAAQATPTRCRSGRWGRRDTRVGV